MAGAANTTLCASSTSGKWVLCFSLMSQHGQFSGLAGIANSSALGRSQPISSRGCPIPMADPILTDLLINRVGSNIQLLPFSRFSPFCLCNSGPPRRGSPPVLACEPWQQSRISLQIIPNFVFLFITTRLVSHRSCFLVSVSVQSASSQQPGSRKSVNRARK